MSENNIKKALERLSKVHINPSYLEIGMSDERIRWLSETYKNMYGIEEDQDLFLKYSDKLRDIKNLMMFSGGSKRIPFNRYDVILIDEKESYNKLVDATVNVLSKNINEKPFFIVYFGYDRSHVKQFCDKYFADFMVSVVDKHSQIVVCAFNNEYKKKYIQEISKRK